MLDVGRYEEASLALSSPAVHVGRSLEPARDDPRKEVDWLLAFARTALDELPRADREGIRYRLLVLTNRGQLGLGKDGPPDIEIQPDWGDGRREDALLPTDEAVCATQRRVQNIFENLLDWHEVTLELGPIKLEILTKYTRGRQSALVTMEADTATTQFNLRLATLLRLHGGYIRECGRCQQRFLARRKDQTFCSHACMNREMQRRARARNKKKKEEEEQRRRDRARTRKKQANRRPHTLKPTQRRTKGGCKHGTKR